MITQNLSDTVIKGALIKAALLCLGAGAAWALLAVWLIYAGSTLLPPRLPIGRIWLEWRRKWPVWVAALALSLAACGWTAEWLLRNVALKNIYWLAHASDMILICRTGVATGYLLVLAAVTIGSLLRRRAAAAPKP